MSMPMETITAETESEIVRAGFRLLEGEGGLRAFAFEPLEREGFPNAFSTRVGGVSAFPEDALNLAGFDQDSAENIHENRRRFLSLLEGDWTLAACWQVHGRDVRVVRDVSVAHNENERCDALATAVPGVLLGVKTADCVPVVMGDARTGACAAVHAGWRGTLAEIVKRTLAALREEFGADPAEVAPRAHRRTPRGEPLLPGVSLRVRLVGGAGLARDRLRFGDLASQAVRTVPGRGDGPGRQVVQLDDRARPPQRPGGGDGVHGKGQAAAGVVVRRWPAAGLVVDDGDRAVGPLVDAA